MTTFNQLLELIRPKQEEISQASSSHLYLRDTLKKLGSNGYIPTISYDFLTGSYIRGTKITPLDDIDLFVVFNGDSLTYYNNGNLVPTSYGNYSNYLDQNGNLSSIKILNSIQKNLPSQYKYTTRDNQALNIYLSTYGIGIDIVPAFSLPDGNYIIPYGHGKNTWLLTNPQKDLDIVENLNNQTNNLFRDIIRIVKYWNKTKNSRRLSSYHLESIAMNVFKNRSDIESLTYGLMVFYNQINYYVRSCPDPTNIGGPISSYLDEKQIQLVNDQIGKAIICFITDNPEYYYIQYLGL